MLCFDCLPTDVQVHILQTWVGSDLGILSALDISFCSHPLRQQFLAWLALACRKREPEAIGVSCIHWMAARGVDVKAVSMTVPPMPMEQWSTQWLPRTATCAKWKKDMATVFQRPSMITVKILCCEQGDAECFATALKCLAEHRSPQLRKLSVISAACTRQAVGLMQCLKAVGPQLTELVLTMQPKSRSGDVDHLFETLCSVCLSLRRFEIKSKYLRATHCTQLLQVNKELVDLHVDATLDDGEPGEAAPTVFKDILHQCSSQLKRFTEVGPEVTLTHFMNLLDRYPKLEGLSIGSCCYSRGCDLHADSLKSSVAPALDGNATTRLAVLCSSSHEEALSWLMNDKSTLDSLGDQYGAYLQSLTLNMGSRECRLDTLLQKCSQLREFVMIDCLEPAFALYDVTTNLKKLRRLSFTSTYEEYDRYENGAGFVQEISDSSLEELFTQCSELKDITLHCKANITTCTLDAILEHKILLSSFTCYSGMSCDWKESDVMAFVETARSCELLPVPVIWLIEDLW